MKIIIIFVGLIVHVNQPWSLDNTAVLPMAPSHAAELAIPYQSLIEPDEDWVKSLPREDEDRIVIELENHSVRLKGSRGIFSNLTDAYQDAIISLSKVKGSCGRLREEVRSRQPGADLAAYFDYRGGRMSPHTYLYQKLSFPNTPLEPERCAPCSAVYDADLRGDEARLILRDKKNKTERVLRIRGGAELIVRNVPKEDTAPHFKHVYSIYEKCEESGVEPFPDTDCTEKGPICRNTDKKLAGRWVPKEGSRFPGSDCTQTGEP